MLGKSSKRGQGLSLSTIVIAILVLIVLVVLILIFTGRLGGFSRGADESSACPNFCKSLGMEQGTKTSTIGKNPKSGNTAKCPDNEKLIPGVVHKGTDGTEYYCCCENA